MFKRNLSAMLVILMIMTMLTGCGTNGMGLLNFYKELSEITEFKFTNKTVLDLGEEILGEQTKLEIQVDGEVDSTDKNSVYLDAEIKLKVDGYDLGETIEFKIVDNKAYTNADTIIEISQLSIGSGDVNPKVAAEIYENIKDYDYIVQDLIPKDNKYGVGAGAINTDLYLEFVEEGFKGFEPKAIKKTNNGYVIEFDNASGLNIIKDLLEYSNKNSDIVAEALLNLLVKTQIEEYKGVENVRVTIDEEGYAENLKEMKSIVKTVLANMLKNSESGELNIYAEALEGSTFKDELIKTQDGYINEIFINLNLAEELTARLDSKTTVKKADVTKKPIVGKLITIEEVEKIEANLTPVILLNVIWVDGAKQGSMMTVKKDGTFSEQEVINFVLIDGRTYLPLRKTCETLGETVEWDNAARKAYIVRGTSKVDMTGIIVDGSTMIKVRDFEKLGYKIDFTQDKSGRETLNSVTIIKQ